MGRRVIRKNKSESGETTGRFENRDGIGENARSTLGAPELDGNVAIGDAGRVPVRGEVEAAREEWTTTEVSPEMKRDSISSWPARVERGVWRELEEKREKRGRVRVEEMDVDKLVGGPRE